ncbi:hypothetical protein EVG20_g2498 [Dentipellis fragilis]|uniref:Uncharacterized protein n=1 Tax=Dentipellis fragilis TaxID=205917 RepID=A0A4Y9Z7L1_9AGAM|nr:hypothetical protein EVG20_g2498 [Dentipellis fragilis]
MRSSSSLPLTYPPPALYREGPGQDPNIDPTTGGVVSMQPERAPNMSAAPGGKSEEKQGGAQRLRGGCVPCPVSTSRLSSVE